MSARLSFQIADAQCECRADPDGVCRQKCLLIYNQFINGQHCVQDKPLEHKNLQGKLTKQKD